MQTSTRTTLLALASCCWLVCACDPAAGDTQEGKAAKAELSKAGDGPADVKNEAAKTGDAAPEGGTAPSEPQVPVTLDGCMAACEQASLSDDDRATCRLRCKSDHGDGQALKHPTIGAYLGCADECASKSVDDRPTCHKNCAASVTAGSGDPSTSVCPRGCLETLGTCLSPCADKREDDAATCRKLCEVNGTKCVEGC